TQRLQVVPHLTLVFPEGAGRDVRRPQGYPVRSREVPESLQARMDVRDVVPQSGLVEPEVVEVEEALRIPAEAEHGPRQEIEVFLSSLIIVAIYRQKTHQVFQKHILLVAVYLLVCAIISNVVISVYVTTQGQAALQDGVILSKRVQATFDYLFGIAIGAFIFVATTASINSRRDFVQYMKSEFPNSYVFYLFLMIITIVTILFSKVTFDPSNPAQIRFEDYFLFVNGIAVATLILYAPYRFITYLRE